MHVTPFEYNIGEQAEALRRFANAAMPDLTAVGRRGWDRVVLTGMGSSHFAGRPTWRSLTSFGLSAWTVDTATLLDNLQLITPDTALVITSQSGASGEAVALIERLQESRTTPRLTVGITADTSSPLAVAADVTIPLHSGAEATVSTKSYLNTLAAHELLTATLTERPVEPIRATIKETADHVDILEHDEAFAASVQTVLRLPNRWVAYAAWGDEVATALFAGLITKEAAKIPAQGFVGGEFRHGPFELAGEGLTAILFGLEGDGTGRVTRLAHDLARTGAHVLVAADRAPDGTVAVPGYGRTRLDALATGALAAEHLAVEFAHHNKVVPGQFVYGQKVTTAL